MNFLVQNSFYKNLHFKTFTILSFTIYNWSVSKAVYIYSPDGMKWRPVYLINYLTCKESSNFNSEHWTRNTSNLTKKYAQKFGYLNWNQYFCHWKFGIEKIRFSISITILPLFLLPLTPYPLLLFLPSFSRYWTCYDLFVILKWHSGKNIVLLKNN